MNKLLVLFSILSFGVGAAPSWTAPSGSIGGGSSSAAVQSHAQRFDIVIADGDAIDLTHYADSDYKRAIVVYEKKLPESTTVPVIVDSANSTLEVALTDGSSAGVEFYNNQQAGAAGQYIRIDLTGITNATAFDIQEINGTYHASYSFNALEIFHDSDGAGVVPEVSVGTYANATPVQSKLHTVPLSAPVSGGWLTIKCTNCFHPNYWLTAELPTLHLAANGAAQEYYKTANHDDYRFYFVDGETTTITNVSGSDKEYRVVIWSE